MSGMKIDKARRLLEAEYEKAKKLEWVHNPVAYALYQVWKKADADNPTEKEVSGDGWNKTMSELQSYKYDEKSSHFVCKITVLVVYRMLELSLVWKDKIISF